MSHPPPPKRVLSDIPEPKRKSGLIGASFNLTNAIVGSGIIGIPFTIKESGLIVGPLLLLLVSSLAVRSLRIIVETASFHPKFKSINVRSYEDLMFMPYGQWGSRFILANKFIFAYGCMVAYLLIIKDTVPVVLGLGEGGATRELVMVITSLVVILPLCLQRDMASLSSASLLSITADVLLVIFMIIYSPVKEAVQEAGGFGEVFKEHAFSSHVFIGLGIISQAMTCHPQAMIVNGSLEDKTSANWATVVRNSLTVAFIMCMIMGLIGFLGYLDETNGDILLNLETGAAANGSRGLVAITMVLTYPLQCFVARHVVGKLLFNGDTDGSGYAEDGTKLEPPRFGRLQYLTIGIYVGTLIPALIFDDLGPVLSITGAIGGSCLGYIGPGLIYLGAHGDSFLEHTNEMIGHKTSHTDPSIELPAAGDAKATMEYSTDPTGSKPFWWFLTLMPIWRAIAGTGSTGMKTRLQLLEEESPGCTTAEPTGEVITAESRIFYLSMFLIAFGVVALVLGVISNIVANVDYY